MIYTVENTMRIGKPLGLVIDAKGNRHWHTHEIDTETGRITKGKTEDGFIFADPETDRMVVETIIAPAPITVLFRDELKEEPPKFQIKFLGCTCPGEYSRSGCPACDRVRERRRQEMLELERSKRPLVRLWRYLLKLCGRKACPSL